MRIDLDAGQLTPFSLVLEMSSRLGEAVWLFRTAGETDVSAGESTVTKLADHLLQETGFMQVLDEFVDLSSLLASADASATAAEAYPWTSAVYASVGARYALLGPSSAPGRGAFQFFTHGCDGDKISSAFTYFIGVTAEGANAYCEILKSSDSAGCAEEFIPDLSLDDTVYGSVDKTADMAYASMTGISLAHKPLRYSVSYRTARNESTNQHFAESKDLTLPVYRQQDGDTHGPDSAGSALWFTQNVRHWWAKFNDANGQVDYTTAYRASACDFFEEIFVANLPLNAFGRALKARRGNSGNAMEVVYRHFFQDSAEASPLVIEADTESATGTWEDAVVVDKSSKSADLNQIETATDVLVSVKIHITQFSNDEYSYDRNFEPKVVAQASILADNGTLQGHPTRPRYGLDGVNKDRNHRLTVEVENRGVDIVNTFSANQPRKVFGTLTCSSPGLGYPVSTGNVGKIGFGLCLPFADGEPKVKVFGFRGVFSSVATYPVTFTLSDYAVKRWTVDPVKAGAVANLLSTDVMTTIGVATTAAVWNALCGIFGEKRTVSELPSRGALYL